MISSGEVTTSGDGLRPAFASAAAPDDLVTGGGQERTPALVVAQAVVAGLRWRDRGGSQAQAPSPRVRDLLRVDAARRVRVGSGRQPDQVCWLVPVPGVSRRYVSPERGC
jgi:hypothetical protein